MKNQQHLIAIIILGLILFNVTFWKEGMGLNVLIFTAFTVPALFYLYPVIRKNKMVQFFGLSTFILAVFIVINHSLLSMVMYFVSYFILLGFSFYYHEHQTLNAGLQGIKQLIFGPFRNIGILSDGLREQLPFNRFFYYIKITIVPLAIVLLFLFLYSAANEIVASYTDHFFKYIGNVFKTLSTERILFFAFSFLCVGAILVAPRNFEKAIQSIPPLFKIIERKKKKRGDFKPHQNGMVNLKKEFRIAQISLIGLNVLIFFVNAIDISTVWMVNPAAEQIHLKTFVHQGTYILIISILIAMSLVVVFFRKNINFFPKNKSLKVLSYAWIIQNAVMVISVFIRNYTYIQWHGLAYKRIGVIVFLLLTLFGLFTMYQKVLLKHSLKYLISRNSLAVYLALLICCGINWDVVITKYNLGKHFLGEVDIRHMVYNMSHKNYYILKSNDDKFTDIPAYPIIREDQIIDGLKNKQSRIMTWHENRTWLSWNLPDWKNKAFIENEIKGIND